MTLLIFLSCHRKLTATEKRTALAMLNLRFGPGAEGLGWRNEVEEQDDKECIGDVKTFLDEGMIELAINTIRDRDKTIRANYEVQFY